ncbi:MAG: 4-hydroxythreonine-4-phosphate dehydrogenase PdxA [Candidatus Omnitrophica bacterium]|nr:4-hydroxythreonine-4-phosphate dehydrogenase PdxA [Candidatus Omnitrophota bacterium]
MGDPAGVGPEVLLKSLSSLRAPRRGAKQSRLTIIGDLGWLKHLSRKLKISVPWGQSRWLDLPNVPPGLKPGRVQPAAGRAAHAYIEEGARLLKAGQAEGLVTAPVCKEAIVKAGIPWVGHTEFLAKAFRRPVVMMFVTGSFRVSLVTTHVSLKELPSQLTREKVAQTIRLTREALTRDFGVVRPRIGLAALNPHAGEGGLFGDEEKRILLPAARRFHVEGPLPVDSLLQAAARGAYDAVVALYHDQALIPVKLLGWGQAVNVTLGLPFVRTSPVHGTAFDLAGKGRADPASMFAALRLAQRLTLRRKENEKMTHSLIL